MANDCLGVRFLFLGDRYMVGDGGALSSVPDVIGAVQQCLVGRWRSCSMCVSAGGRVPRAYLPTPQRTPGS